MKLVRPKSKNHLIFVVGAAMSFGLIYLFVAPKLVKPAAPAAAPVKAMRGHGGHKDESFLAHAYAVRDTSISDVYPYRFRLQGGV